MSIITARTKHLIDLALEGIRELCTIQRRTLDGVGVNLDGLLIPR